MSSFSLNFRNMTVKGHTKCLYLLVALLFASFYFYFLRTKDEKTIVKVFREGALPIDRQDYPTGHLSRIDGLHPDVNIVPSSPAPDLKLPYRDCIPLPEAPEEGVIICLHPASKDRGVSGTLKKNVLWERDLMFLMDGRLRDDPSLTFFDIGCNIGEYTLWAAALGRTVVAVEMLITNVHMIQTSLSLSGLTDKVTIVNNALYKDHRTLETNFVEGSIGASRLNTSKMFGKKEEHVQKTLVKTICIDDLVPLMKGENVYIKMDIENSEHTALACADRFFDEVNVKVVQMEWHRRTPEESIPIIQFMEKHGYVSSLKPMPYVPVNLQTNKKAIDVFFLKKTEFGIK